ncbi:thiol:disulfide interchange protein DsbG [Lysobacter sp. GX 14042]|uniref:thiol:disulfide interchange protein DsbG n=1 Tax=Lysobacter sp. GX 14042 TaxID=2907155 RepID=UPI001F213991|nr:thiol:disulfide interchange protein DsbG [Lysobacter sp. GX 14042]MCE7031450.1 thiol:disulfide interchange protein DsbG [Lysobacter sp. GX 14042]
MKQLNLTAAALALTLVGTAGCSHAEEPGKAHPPVIATIEEHGLEVLGEFDAPADLRGFAGLAGQQPVAVYVTPDGEHALVGQLVNVAGEDVGGPHLQRLVAKPMSDRIWSQLEDSTWVADGPDDAPRVVYTFSDPNCPFCNRFWQSARPWVDAGKVQIRHVMVGVIKADSANKVATILTADSPSEMLGRNEREYATGGIKGMATVPAGVRSQLDSNQMLMHELGFQGTPGILFRDADGVVQRRSGAPTPGDLPTVLGPR